MSTAAADCGDYAAMARRVSPYGDGLASSRIVDALGGRDVKPFDPESLRDAPGTSAQTEAV